MRQVERIAELEDRLPSVLRGERKPADAEETRSFADLCYRKKLYGASTRFWHAAFQAEPALAENLQSADRYNAACSAALAGCGKGRDDPPLDEKERSQWRAQAVAWLKADLVVFREAIQTETLDAPALVRQKLAHGRQDPEASGKNAMTPSEDVA